MFAGRTGYREGRGACHPGANNRRWEPAPQNVVRMLKTKLRPGLLLPLPCTR